MADHVINIKLDYDALKQNLRDILINEGFGELWIGYCQEYGVPADIKLGFLEYLANHPDKLFKE